MSDGQFITKYLTDLLQDGFWGGAECLAAVSRFKKVKINVFAPTSHTPVSFSPDNLPPAYELNLLYSNNHYDSLIPPIIPSSLSLPTSHPSLSHVLPSPVQRTIYAPENPYRLIDSTPQPPSPIPSLSSSFNFATWNVRGLSKPQKRENVDSILFKNSVDVCGNQEINMGSSTCSSDHYLWYLSNFPTARRCGVGILVKKDSSIRPKLVKHYHGSVITLLGSLATLGEILFIFACVPSQTSKSNRRRASTIFSTIHSILDKCPSSRDVVLLGDFNARLGSSDS